MDKSKAFISKLETLPISSSQRAEWARKYISAITKGSESVVEQDLENHLSLRGDRANSIDCNKAILTSPTRRRDRK